MSGSSRRAARALLLPWLLAAVVLAAAPWHAAAQGRMSRTELARALERVETLRAADDLEGAVRELELLLDRDPTSGELLRAHARISGERGDGGQTLPFAERAVSASSEPELVSIWVQALVGAGLPDSARAVAASRVEAEPDRPAWRLLLAAAQLAGGAADAAAATLEAGAAAFPDVPEFTHRRAALAAERGDHAVAVRYWLELLPTETGVERVVAGLVDAPGTADRLWAAVERDRPELSGPAALLALRLGEPDRARAFARDAEPEDLAARLQFLRSYVDVADAEELPAEVAWAAEALAVASPRPIDQMRWRARSADQSLVAGDTARARERFVALRSESRPGDPAHGVATHRLFDLLVRQPGRLEEARALWDGYPESYPDSAGIFASMTGDLALAEAGRGDDRAAASTLSAGRRRLADPTGQGPLDAAAGRISLMQGQRDSAVAQLTRAVVDPSGEAVWRSDLLELLAVVEVASDEEAAHLGEGLRTLAAGRLDVGAWLSGLDARPAGPARAGVLAAMARGADRAGRAADARQIRLRLVERHPRSAEAPGALLELARSADSAAAQRDWLERLVTGFPTSSLAPLGRRMLAELGPPGGAG